MSDCKNCNSLKAELEQAKKENLKLKEEYRELWNKAVELHQKDGSDFVKVKFLSYEIIKWKAHADKLAAALSKRYTNCISPTGTAKDAELDALLAEHERMKEGE